MPLAIVVFSLCSSYHLIYFNISLYIFFEGGRANSNDNGPSIPSNSLLKVSVRDRHRHPLTWVPVLSKTRTFLIIERTALNDADL